MQHKTHGSAISFHNRITTLGKSSIHGKGTIKIAAVSRSFQYDSSLLLKDSLLDYNHLPEHSPPYVSLAIATEVLVKSKSIA